MLKWPQILAQPFLWLILLGVAATGCRTAALPPTPALPSTPDAPVVTVAILSPISGETTPLGRQLVNGVTMAFDRWNAKGGPLQHHLTWRIYDSECDFEAAGQAAQQAIDEGYRLLIGPLCSEAAIAAATVAEANEAVLIAPTAIHPLVTVNGDGQTRPTVFRVSYTHHWQGQAMARFALEDLAVRRAALLYEAGDDDGAALAAAFEQTFRAGGGTIVHQTAYSADTVDFSNILTAIRQTGTEAVYLPGDAIRANQIVAQLKRDDEPSPILLGSDHWAMSDLDHAQINAGYYPAHFTPTDERLAIQTWTDEYKATYAIEAETLAALGYDAAHLLASAAQQAGTLDPADIAIALGDGTFQTITGPLQFEADHNPLKPVPIIKIGPDGTTVTTIIQPDFETDATSP